MLAGPTLMAFGTEQQQQRWLPAMLRSDEVWCQGFSEPDAGSDLASLRTRAVRRGDELVVNGQKIWTTGAHYSDWIFALVRTSNEGPKHHGITWLMVDLRSPGVVVRPIVQLNGRAEFAEVFFDDVRVPLANVVGGIGNGWRVAMAALGFERGVGRRSYVQYLTRLEQLRRVASWRTGVALDPALEREFGDVLAKVLMYRDYTARVAARGDAARRPPDTCRVQQADLVGAPGRSSSTSANASCAPPGVIRATRTARPHRSGWRSTGTRGPPGSSPGPTRSRRTSSPTESWGCRDDHHDDPFTEDQLEFAELAAQGLRRPRQRGDALADAGLAGMRDRAGRARAAPARAFPRTWGERA